LVGPFDRDAQGLWRRELQHAGPSREGWTDSATAPVAQSRLIQLTNHAVVDAAVVDGKRLVLTFDHGHSLTLIDDNDHYEALSDANWRASLDRLANFRLGRVSAVGSDVRASAEAAAFLG
jgi:hypothetical protein